MGEEKRQPGKGRDGPRYNEVEMWRNREQRERKGSAVKIVTGDEKKRGGKEGAVREGNHKKGRADTPSGEVNKKTAEERKRGKREAENKGINLLVIKRESWWLSGWCVGAAYRRRRVRVLPAATSGI